MYISESIKVTLEIENVTSIQGAPEGNTLKHVNSALRSALEIWLVIHGLNRLAQTKVS